MVLGQGRAGAWAGVWSMALATAPNHIKAHLKWQGLHSKAERGDGQKQNSHTGSGDCRRGRVLGGARKKMSVFFGGWGARLNAPLNSLSSPGPWTMPQPPTSYYFLSWLPRSPHSWFEFSPAPSVVLCCVVLCCVVLCCVVLCCVVLCSVV